MRDSDRGLVISSWLKSFSGRSQEARDYGGPDRRVFSHDYVPIVLHLMSRSTILMACLDESPDVVLGWMAWEGETLHYVATKQRWRGLGVAKWMLRDFVDMPVVYTHRTTRWLFEDWIEVKDMNTGGLQQRPVPYRWSGFVHRCPVPKTWTYRRWLIWPREDKAA